MFTDIEVRRWFDAVARIAAIAEYLEMQHKGGVIQDEIVNAYLDRNPAPTLQAIGDEFGISRERVRQILERNSVGNRRRKLTKTEIRRFLTAIAYAAKVTEFEMEHGTLRRHRGAFGISPCRCDDCRRAHRERCYASIGYTPKTSYETYRKYVKRHGVQSRPLTKKEIENGSE